MSKALAKQNIEPPAAPSPTSLIELALKNSASIEQIKELMDLQDRWEKKQAKKAFFDALSRFQTMVPVLKKGKVAKINSQKGNYSYKYADLGSIAGQLKDALSVCGLSYRWEFEPNGSNLKVICFISHRDGHTEITTMEAGMDTSGYKNDIQQKGSTATYLQRYTLIGALGLTTADEDNDGRNHSEPPPAPTEEEILDQWKQSVNGVKTRVALKSLYLSNQKAVDGNPKVQSIFKSREEQLPLTTKVDLP